METRKLPEAEEASPAIKALGPLFKLTEVHLWNSCSVQVRGGLFSKPGKPIHKDNVGSSDSVTSNVFLPLPEDLELTRQMNDLGLPISFQTNKEKRTATSEGKRKDPKKKNLHHHKDIDNDMLDSVRQSEEADTSSAILNDSESNTLFSISMLGLGEQSYSDLEVKTNVFGDEISDHGLHFGFDCDSGLAKGLLEKDIEMEFGRKLDNECSSGSCLVDGSTGHGRKEPEQKERDHACMEAAIRADNEAEVETLCNDVNIELMHESQAAPHAQFIELVDCDTADSSNRGVFGDWRAYWDYYYRRTYYYNISTQESTWELPPGTEDVTFTDAANDPAELRIETEDSNASLPDSGESNELVISCVVEHNIDLTNESRNDNGSSDLSFNDSRGSGLSADSFCKISNGKKKKKMRRLKSHGKFPNTSEESHSQGILDEISPSISKYWCQRYMLFSRFDEGIQMDEEGWFSVTPEPIARHHASRCAGGVIVDCFTGVGGNAIQFAQRSEHVIAIDIDPRKIGYAQHNAAVYGVGDLIDFVIGDCILLAPKLKADTVFLSPPWGGPDYAKVKMFDINIMLRPIEGHFLFQVAKAIAPKVVMFLPRNVDVNQLAELALSAGSPWSLEVEKNYLNGKLKAITAYFNERTA